MANIRWEVLGVTVFLLNFVAEELNGMEIFAGFWLMHVSPFGKLLQSFWRKSLPFWSTLHYDISNKLTIKRYL